MNQGNKPPSPDQKKISHLGAVVLCLLALLYLTGCSDSLPEPQEMGNMALLRSFAVDQGENYRVTVSTGLQRKGLSQVEPLVLQAQSSSLQGACGKITAQSDDYVFFGYIDQLLLGEELAREGVNHTLDFFAHNSQLSLGTALWLTEGEAGTLLQENPEEEKLSNLMEESNLGVGGITRKVGEVLTDLRQQGDSYLPILGQRTDGTLIERGYGLLSGESLVEILEGELARGLELLLCHPQLQEFSVFDGVYALELSQIRSCLEGKWDESGGLYGIQIQLSLLGDVLEAPHWGELEGDVLLQIEQDLAEQCNETLWKLQDSGCDALHIQEQFAMKYCGYWQEYGQDWDFSRLSLSTKVTVEIVGHQR